MGVQGLIPFLTKACPNVIQRLPNRFQDIRGSRVVIDGTLITQRFHFSPTPHPYRHVLRWYQLSEEMRKSDVTAICIFDGKGRHSAKSKEVLRRREHQQLAVARGRIESARLQRLKFLHSFLGSISAIPTADLRPTLEYLHKLTSQDANHLAVQEALQTLLSQDGPLPPDESGPITLPTSPTPEEMDLTKFREIITPMYEEYARSLSQLSTLTKETAEPAAGVDQNVEKEFSNRMSRGQSKLAEEEQKLWKGLSSLPEDDPQFIEALSSTSAELVLKSDEMSTSFARRTHPPTVETYQQSQEILKAMGIQCIVSEGHIEAEGLASSMVLNGQADFVASEDTDVLVYGATLLRKLTGSGDALEITSAKDIRDSLALDHRAFIDFALLLGTDFSQRPKNVGPVRAFNFIKNHGSIEEILKCQPKYPPRNSHEEYLEEIKAARSIFNSRPATNDLGLVPMSFDEAAVSDVLKRYNLEREMFNTSGWDLDDIIDGGYFSDTPTAA